MSKILVTEDLLFYKISFENENLVLTKTVLNKHFDLHKKKSGYLTTLRTHFKNYYSGIIGFVLCKDNIIFHKVYIGIERNALLVSCKCGMAGEFLCDHAHHVLTNFVGANGWNLTPYYWPGYDTDEVTVKRFLNVKLSWKNLKIKSNGEYGNLFVKNRGFKNENFLVFDHLRSKISIRKQGGESVLGYHFLYFIGHFYWCHLPIILPFVGVTNKKTAEIGSFKKYVMKDDLMDAKIELTQDQVLLNKICYRMYDLSAIVSNINDRKRQSEALKNAMPEMLLLWKEAIPILNKQPYLRGSYSWDLNLLSDRPRKRELKKLIFFLGTLQIAFLIKEQLDHYTLEPIIQACHKDISEDYGKLPLFVADQLRSDFLHFHLFDNLQDEYLISWLGEANKKLTILKDDFDEFRDDFLAKLDDYYIIYFLAYKSRQKVRWNRQKEITPGYYQQLADDWGYPTNKQLKT